MYVTEYIIYKLIMFSIACNVIVSLRSLSVDCS